VASWRTAYRGLVPDEVLDDLSVDERERMWSEWLGLRSSAATRTWVADDEGRVAGFAAAGAARDPDASPSTGELAFLYLDPYFWGRGWGRALLRHSVDRLREGGYEAATLWVLEGNDRARRFYEAAGWRDEGGRKDCFGGHRAPAVRYRIAFDPAPNGPAAP
jgi:ribosomal protein S18 acetylase RimI-like enzyme